MTESEFITGAHSPRAARYELPAGGLELVQSLYWRLPAPVFVLAAEGFTVCGANQAATRLFEGESASLQGLDIRAWLPDDMRLRIEQTVWRPGSGATVSDKSTVLPYRGDRRRRHQMRLTAFGLPTTDAAYWGLVCEELPEQRETHSSQQDNADRLAQFLQAMPVPAWVTDRNLDYVFQNPLCNTLPRCRFHPDTCPSAPDVSRRCLLSSAPDAEQDVAELYARVQATGLICDTQMDFGVCGLWHIVMFPVMHGAADGHVAAVAVDMRDAERDRQQASRYIAQVQALVRDAQHAREDARAEVARDIHDHLGQEITVLRLAVGRLQREMQADGSAPAVWREQVEALSAQVAEVMRSTKRIALERRPEALFTQGLALASSELVSTMRQRLGIRGGLEVSGEWEDPEQGLAMNIYRSLQELLNNMAKHAQASRFFVRLHLDDHNVYWLEVHDNGVGIPVETWQSRGGGWTIGMKGLHERAAIYGGEVTLASRPDIEGSSIVITFPERRNSPDRGA